MAAGKFPGQSGQPVLVDRFAFHDCCCDPCLCYWEWEWDCDADDWVLVKSGKAGADGDFNGVPPPYDQFNYFYRARQSPRSGTVILATYGTWLADCESSCTSPGSPAAPNETYRAWKCDSPEPTEPVDDGKCQDIWIYQYDCCEGEWLDPYVSRTIPARRPKGFTLQVPDRENTYEVYGEPFTCGQLPSLDPPAPGEPNINESEMCSAEDEYTLTYWRQFLDFYGGDSDCDSGSLGVESEKRVKDDDPITLTKTGCDWVGTFQIENRNVGGSWALYSGGFTFTATLSYDYETGLWTLEVNTDLYTRSAVITWSGSPLSPVGSHSEDYECSNAETFDYTSGSVECTLTL